MDAARVLRGEHIHFSDYPSNSAEKFAMPLVSLVRQNLFTLRNELAKIFEFDIEIIHIFGILSTPYEPLAG